MKSLLTWVAILTLTGIAVSCSDDSSMGIPTPNQPTEGSIKLSLSLQLPGIDAVPYSYEVASDPEVRVDSLDIYLFERATTGDGGAVSEYFLVKKYEQEMDFNPVTIGEGKQSLSITVDNPNSKRLYFIANDSIKHASLQALTVGKSTEEDFLRLMTAPAERQGLPLLMTAYKEISETELQTSGGTHTIGESIELTRMVARIDIENREKGFAIDSVQILNTPAQSLIYGNGSLFAEDVDNSVARENMPIVRIDDALRFPPKTEGTVTAGWDSIPLKSLCYPFEGLITSPISTPELRGTSIRIWGRSKPNGTDQNSGTKVIYTFNLNNGSNGTNNIGKLVRNHRYLLIIESALTELNATLVVKDWLHEETDTFNYVINPAIKLTDTQDNQLSKISIAKTGTQTNGDTVKVVAPFDWDIDVDYLGGANWITVTPATITYAGENSLIFEAAANDSEEARKAIITIKNSANEDEKASFVVEQLPTKTVLDKWAHQNLANVGKFVSKTETTGGLSTGVDTDEAYDDPSEYGMHKSYGAWFQWGRNKAFTNQVISDLTDTSHVRISFSEGVNNNKFIVTPSGLPQWYKETGWYKDTWYKISGIDVPQGSNGSTNPCPSGYRLPTAEDLLEIIPANGTVGTYDISNQTGIFPEENRTAYFDDGELESGNVTYITSTTPAYYYGGGVTGTGTSQQKIVYGVKRQGSNKAYAVCWKYIGTSVQNAEGTFSQISVIPVSSDFKPKSVTEFDALDWESETSRYFPATGRRRYIPGVNGDRGITGEYWSSSLPWSGVAYCMNIGVNSVKLQGDGQSLGISIRCVKNND